MLRARQRVGAADHEQDRVEVVGHVEGVVVGEPDRVDEFGERRLAEVPHEDVVRGEERAHEDEPGDGLAAPGAQPIDPEEESFHRGSFPSSKRRGPGDPRTPSG